MTQDHLWSLPSRKIQKYIINTVLSDKGINDSQVQLYEVQLVLGNYQIPYLYTSNMLRTPKIYKQFKMSDFRLTCNPKKSDLAEPQESHDEQNTLIPLRNCFIFAPLPDRQLPLNQFFSIKNNRARIIDWYLQIFSAYRLGWGCFWMTIQLLDSLIAEFNYVTQANIHLVGIVCCFIVAKYQGKSMLNMFNIVRSLGHNKFSEREVIMEERQILLLVFSRSNFQRNNLYSYLLQKYLDFSSDVLTQAMKMMTVAMMRPDVAFQELTVRTYQELVDFIISEIVSNRKVPILQEIYKYMNEKFGANNLQHGDKMLFV